MVRKSQRLKNSAVGNTSNNSADDDVENHTVDYEFKCKYCNVISATVIEKQTHEESCESQSSSNFFVTSDGKTRFLCSVSTEITTIY